MEFDTGEHSQGVSSSESRRARRVTLSVTSANAGDHKPIYDFLRVANCAPSYEDYLASFDEPTYEPTDRLLAKYDGQIVGHARVLNRIAWFHGIKLPIGGIECFATLPEYRDAGCERLLLAAAEQALRDSQSVLALALTDRYDAFRAAGWCDVESPPCTVANVHDVLARLAAKPPLDPLAPRARPLSIRRWRQVELDALLDVYRHAAAASWGALDRTEPYWRWLIGRNLHDELIVAIHGRDDWDSLESLPHIVGYAITRGSQVVELATLPEFGHAAAPLLTRACQDAIEHDHCAVSLQLPAADPLHQVLLNAGGRWAPKSRGTGSWMAKLVAPARWIESIYGALQERAKEAGLARPLTLNFNTGGHTYRLELTRRSSHFIRAGAARPDVLCSPQVLGAILLGAVDVAAACNSKRIECGSESSQSQLTALFPQASFWQSSLDSLRS